MNWEEIVLTMTSPNCETLRVNCKGITIRHKQGGSVKTEQNGGFLVNIFCGISISGNWKLQVSTVWEYGQHYAAVRSSLSATRLYSASHVVAMLKWGGTLP